MTSPWRLDRLTAFVRRRFRGAAGVAPRPGLEEEVRLRLALSAGGMGIWDWDVTSGAVTWTGELEAMYGLAPGTFDGRFDTVFATIHPDDRARLDDAIRLALTNGQPFTVEYRVMWPDESMRWLVSQGTAFFDAAGRGVRMLGVTADITGRKRSEAERTRAEQRARSLAEAGHFLSQTLDPDEVGQRITDSVRGLFGLTTALFYQSVPDAGDLVLVAFSGDIGPRWPRSTVVPRGTGTVGLAVERRQPVLTADVLTDPAVTLTPEIRARVERAPYRAVLAVPLIVHDTVVGALALCDRRGRTFDEEDVRMAQAFADQAALALANARLYREARASESQYRSLLEGSIQGIYIERDARIVFANRALARMFGYEEPEALTGIDVGALFAPEERPAVEARSAAWRRGDAVPARYLGRGVRADRDHIWIEALASPVSWDGGPAVLTTLFDVTDRRRAEDARAALLALERRARADAEAANRAKDDFLATLSHELRTPLNAILGWAQLLRAGDLPPDKAARAVETIARNAQLQTQLVDDLLDVSRIITGKLNLEIRAVELPAVVDATVESARPAAELKGVRLSGVLDRALPVLPGDPERLQQILYNLLSNAIKFTPPAGHVEVRLERMPRHARLTVADTGIGIDPEFLPHVFDRFRQGDPSSTRRHRGLGLGLAIVRHLVELHGGSVRAESPGHGKGATFIVDLPLQRTERPPAEPEAETTPDRLPSLVGVRVLVVDDEPDMRDLVTTVLEQQGAAVRAALSTSEALDALAAFAPDVLLCDIGMPGEDGYALIRQVRAREAGGGRHLAAVAITAYARPEDRTRALVAGFHAHLAKPVQPEELTVVVASLAGRRS
jgi:PAS domain S-box-containing protein